MLPRASHTLFGIRDEYLSLALIMPLILSCMLTDPILVSVEKFNNGQSSALLTYTAGPQNQSFGFNISKYVVEGNWSQDGIFRNYTVQLCPVSGAPSNLVMHFPETGASALLWMGVLTSCENVTVPTDGFDPYFNTTTGTLLNIGLLPDFIFGSGLSELNVMMLKNPKMYHLAEPVDYTLFLPFFRSDEVDYRCQDGDIERTVTTPVKEWDIVLPLPGGLGPMPFPLPVIFGNGTTTMRASIWDLPCPAYGAAGKYRGRISRVHLYLENQTWAEYFYYDDDFDTPAFNTSAWDVRTANSSEYPTAITAGSNLILDSPLVPTAIYSYYYLPVTPNDTEQFDFSVNVSNEGIPDAMAGIGAIAFMNALADPGTSAELTTNVSKLIMFNGSMAALLCNLSAGPSAAVALTPGYHVFTANSSGENLTAYVDGAFLGNCSGELGFNGTVYYMFTPDPLTDQFYGNASVEWANATVYDWNGTDWQAANYFDHFDGALNTTAWLIRNNTVQGYAYYVNNWTSSKLDLYSGSPTNSSGIIVFYDRLIPATGFGTTFVINMSINNSEMSGDMAGVFLSRSKFGPGPASTVSTEVEGAVFYNQTDYAVFCDYSAGGLPDMTGTFAAGNSTIIMMLNESLPVYIVDGTNLSSCPAPTSDYYFGFTSDPFTNSGNGNASLDNVSLFSFAMQNVTGWRWLDFEAPDYAYFVQAFNFTLNSSSDVIVRDCSDSWNCPYEFNVSSDSAGAVNVSIVNISYENLIGYEHGAPTMSISGPTFSWMGSNSTITASDVRYQSGVFDSRVTNSEVILSDIYCTNVTGSSVLSSVRLSEFDNTTFEGILPMSMPSIRFDPNPCGEIVNSNLSGAFMLGGSAYNSSVVGGGGIFMDLYNARFENFTLTSGRVVLNVTKYGAHAAEWLTEMGMDNSSLDLTMFGGIFGGLVMPVGCTENAVFAAEGFPEAKLGDMEAPFSCLVELHDIHVIFTNMSLANTTIGGPTISLDNASFTIDNESGSFNVLVRQPAGYLIFWDLNTSGGAVSFNSSRHYVEEGLASLDPAFYNWTEGRVVTIGLNATDPNATIYYYPGYTGSRALVLSAGTRCNAARCQNASWAGGMLVFNVTNFSSYALGGNSTYSLQYGGGSGSPSLSMSFSPSCQGNVITVKSGQTAVAGADISVIDGATLITVFSGTTNGSGQAGFGACGMDVRLYAGKEGYIPASMTAALPSCGQCAATANRTTNETIQGCASDGGCAYNQRCSSGSCTDIAAGRCGYFANHSWFDYPCCADADCGANETCSGHACASIQPAAPPNQTAQAPPQPSPAQQQQPAAPQTTDVGGVQAGPQQCCLLGICGSYMGLCWYWWVVLVAVLLAVLAALTFVPRLLRKR